MQTTTASYRYTTVPLASKRLHLQESEAPLPCRGCTTDCPDYAQCLGRPWRLENALSENQQMKFGGS